MSGARRGVQEESRGTHRQRCSRTGSQQQSEEKGYPEGSEFNNLGFGSAVVQRKISSPELTYSGISQVYRTRTPEHKTELSSSRGVGRGRARGRGLVDIPVEPSNPSDKIIGDQNRHTPARNVGRGRARGRQGDNTSCAPTDYSEQISERIKQDQQGGSSLTVQDSKDPGVGCPYNEGGDQLREARGQCEGGTVQQCGNEDQTTLSLGEDQYSIRGRKDERNQQSTEQSETTSNSVCLYCGDILHGEDLCTAVKGVYHQECLHVYVPYIKRAVDAFRNTTLRKKHVLYMAVPVKHVYVSREQKQDKKEKKGFRDAKVTDLLDKASALRNSNSGFLLIHLVGLDPDDNFTGAFDEFADVKLQGLISDGSLFDDVYKKSRLSDYPQLKEFHDILVLYVEAADLLITSDFKTKIALDDCIVDASDQNLFKIIKDRRHTEGKFHEISAKNAEDLCNLQENRHIQTKAYFPKPLKDNSVLNILKILRAVEYISAFSKNKDGGSYLLGLAEVPRNFEKYRSKRLRITPVPIHNCDVAEQCVKDYISSTCLVCDYTGKEASGEDLVKISFIPTRDSDDYVVHISVPSVSGIVFYEKSGPVSYRVDTQQAETNAITRLTAAEWFRAFRQQLRFNTSIATEKNNQFTKLY